MDLSLVPLFEVVSRQRSAISYAISIQRLVLSTQRSVIDLKWDLLMAGIY
jgi:hypothetical protein